MVKRKYAMSPVQGGVRRRRTTTPKMNGTLIEYNTQQAPLPVPTAAGYSGYLRRYIPGSPSDIANTIGPDIVSAYSSAKFLPGTKLRFEPSVSFNTTGRVFCGFIDNPEVAAQLEALLFAAILSGLAADWAAYMLALKGLGSVISFPVWQETEVAFPTRLRRKMFDTNATFTTPVVDVYDRCLQTCMFVGIEGLNTTGNPGGFWYHDKLEVEGLHSRLT